MDDFFDDVLEVPAARKARPALSKFQPKVRGGLKKGPSASCPTNPPKVSEEENVSQTTNSSAVTKSLGTVPSGNDLLTDPLTSSISEIPDDVATIKTSSKLVSLQSDGEIADAPCCGIAMPDIIVEDSSGFGNITAEADPTGFEHNPVGKLLPVPAPQDIARIDEAMHPHTSHGITATPDMVSCSQHALFAGVDFQIDSDRAETEERDNLGEHGIVRESLDNFPESISASGFGQISEELLTSVELENGREKLGDDIPCPADESIERPDSHLVHPRNNCNDEESVPASADDDTIDYSALGFDYSTYDPNDINPLEPSRDAASAQDVQAGAASGVDVSLQPKNSTAGVDKSVRQLRKRVANRLDGSDNRVHDDGNFSAEVDSYLNADDIDDDNDDREQGSSKKKKRVAQKRKGDGKSVESTEKPRRKFSHSTRRTRRRVNEALLQIPEDEIDYKKLKIKDLILLAEQKERLAKKNAVSNSQPANQNADKSSQGNFVNHEEESAASEDEGSPRQAGATVQPNLMLFNYQSHMNKTPTTRWSKQDTELFYEGIRQFGTDLMMIKELFPNLTRHQIKLKYKKEERQNPLRLSEALADRARDHSHFQLVIKRLQAASQKENDSNVDPSVGTTGKGDPASQVNEEVRKPEEDDAGGSLKTDDAGGRDPEGEGEVHNSAKSDESDEVDIFQILSSYQSEF